MSLKLFLLGIFAISSAGHVILRGNERPRCGVEGATDAYKASIENAKAQLAETRKLQIFSDLISSGLTVDVHVHVIAGSQNRSDGYLTKQELDDQMAVINSTFQPTGISFNVIGTDYIINTDWTTDPDDNTIATMKRALHVGDYRTLNLYFLQNLVPYGVSTLPMVEVNTTQPDKLLLDGCVIRPDTVPGGSAANTNEGKTATHEIGHWFGLWHTFEPHGRIPPNPPSGCVGIGDEVDDTPAQQYSTFGCPDKQDSCPNLPGLDPIHNYMDYSFDSCMHEFTPGQVY